MLFCCRGCDQIHYAVCECVVHVYEWVFMVACAHACVCLFLHACLCLYVAYQKGAKIQNIINWILFVLPLYMMSYTTESERSLPWSPWVHEPWKTDTSNWATRAERVSCHIGRRGGWCLLTFKDGQTSQPTLAVCVVSHFQSSTPSPPNLSSLVLPPASRWIFSHSLTLKTLLTARATVREWGRCVCAVCVMWLELRATPTKLRSSANVNRHQKNRIMHADEGGAQGSGCGLKVRWPPLYGSKPVNNSLSWGWLMSLPVPVCHSGTAWHFVVATVELRSLSSYTNRYFNSCNSLESKPCINPSEDSSDNPRK